MKIRPALVSFCPVYRVRSALPGQLLLQRGDHRDYRRLERFHYRPKRPASFAQVWTIRYRPPDQAPALGAGIVAVGVLSYPTLANAQRERALRLARLSPDARARFVNRHVRTISRVAVHPAFRSLGLATLLVRCMIHHCDTRYVEAVAAMGHAHPLFERAGMMRLSNPRARDHRPVYYLRDRVKHPPGLPDCHRCGCDLILT